AHPRDPRERRLRPVDPEPRRPGAGVADVRRFRCALARAGALGHLPARPRAARRRDAPPGRGGGPGRGSHRVPRDRRRVDAAGYGRNAMSDRVSVGVETNGTAPLRLELTSMRVMKLMGVDSLFLPDHYLSFVPRSVWGPGLTPAAKVVPSPDAFFDPFVLMGTMA